MEDTLIHLVSWSAYAAAIASIVSFVALLIFFAGHGIFGPINDAVSVAQFLLLIPVALAHYQHFRERLPLLSGVITLIAVPVWAIWLGRLMAVEGIGLSAAV